MKNLFVVVTIKLLLINIVCAQQVKIAANAQLRINAGTSLIRSDLTFTPSAALNLSDVKFQEKIL